MSEIYSLQIERHVLGGLIKYPDIFPEIDGFVTEKDFFSEVHHTIFNVIKSCAYQKESIDKVILATKIKELGVSFKDDINVYDYIENISFAPIQKKAVIESVHELVKYRIRREIESTGKKLRQEAETNGSKDVDEIIADCDAIYNDKISGYADTDQPEKITDGILELLEEAGNSPEDENGLASPYEEFNRLYGGFKCGHIYAICSRPGEGKTTWLADVCFKTAKENKVKALYLDTEMTTEEIRFRMAASISGVPTWYLETGQWRKNPDYYQRVRAAEERLNQDNDFYHMHVANKSIDKICSLVKRWYYNEVGRGNKCLVVYDYVKLTGEQVGRNWAEYQAIGEKINRLKELAVEVNAPMLTAMQLNRSAEGSERVDNSSAISLSDRLQWFAAFVGIFRQKDEDELLLDNEYDENGNIQRDFGTHKLIPVKTRFQGRDAMGHANFLRRIYPDGSQKYVGNYINFSLQNFGVTEMGSLRHICERAREMYSVDDGSPNDGATEL